MSYLPRMSKTYKEPEERKHEDGAEEITFNSIPIASALPDGRAYNPQSVLKQYNYYPHPPPQLPGPSLIEEAEQNEKISVQTKRRRTIEESVHAPDKGITEEFAYESERKTTTINVVLTAIKPPKEDNAGMLVTPPKTTVTEKVSKKVHLTYNPFEEELSELETKYSVDENNEQKTTANETESILLPSKKRIFNSAANEIQRINDCHENDDSVKTPLHGISSDEISTVRKFGSENIEILNKEKRNVPKGLIHQGVQCYLHGLNEKTFSMPCSVHYLMKTLSFLVLELDKKENENVGTTKEVKKLLNQINEFIAGLLSCHTILGYTLQTSVSDLKRLEKIHIDLEEYVKLVYGERGKFGCKCEEKKNVYCKLSQKDYELEFLHEKLREGGIQNPNLKFMYSAIKSPEVILQNKNLENEQLAAEIEFNNEELTRFQKALAEKNWEIHKSKEEMAEVKKKFVVFKSRSKK